MVLEWFKFLAGAEFPVLLCHFAQDLRGQGAQLLSVPPVHAAERDDLGFSPLGSPIPHHRQQTPGNSLSEFGEKHPGEIFESHALGAIGFIRRQWFRIHGDEGKAAFLASAPRLHEGADYAFQIAGE
jgi:hypothetical protein